MQRNRVDLQIKVSTILRIAAYSCGLCDNGAITTTESLSEVASHLPPPEELRVAFREHVRVVARARAATSADYEPRRLVATARFLRQNRYGLSCLSHYNQPVSVHRWTQASPVARH